MKQIKTKKNITEPLFDKRELKEAAERIKLLEKILNPTLLYDLLDVEIRKRMLVNHIQENYGAEKLEGIEKLYAKEIKIIYQTLMPEHYNKSIRAKKIIDKAVKGKKIKK